MGKLFLSQICWFSQLIVFLGVEIVNMCRYEFSLWELLVLSFRLHDLLNFIVNNIFLHSTEPEISGIDFPVVVSLLLFSSFKILMGLEIHLPYLFTFGHVDSWINCIFSSMFILFSFKSIFKLLSFGHVRQVVISIKSLAEWLPIEF